MSHIGPSEKHQNTRKAGVVNYKEMLGIIEQFENIGLLCDTGERPNGKVMFRFGVPSPEQLEEFYYYCKLEPAASLAESAWALARSLP
jgi:hypothetical protein